MKSTYIIICFFLGLFGCKSSNQFSNNNFSGLFELNGKIYYSRLNNDGDGEIYDLLNNSHITNLKGNLGIPFAVNNEIVIINQRVEKDETLISISNLSSEGIFNTAGEYFASDNNNIIFYTYSDFENELISLISFPSLKIIKKVKESNISAYKGTIYLQKDDTQIELYDYRLNFIKTVSSSGYYSAGESIYIPISIEKSKILFNDIIIPTNDINIDNILYYKQFERNTFLLLKTKNDKVILINNSGKQIEEINFNKNYQYSIIYLNEKFCIGFTTIDDDFINIEDDDIKISGQLYLSKNSYDNVIVYKNETDKFTIRSSLYNKIVVVDEMKFLDDSHNLQFNNEKGPIIYYKIGVDFFIVDRNLDILFSGKGKMLRYVVTPSVIAVLYFDKIKTIKYEYF